jgi:DNA-binding MarR family transcriptional regulator
MKSKTLNKDVVVSVMQANNCIMDKLARGLKPFGLSIQQFNVLRILRGQQDNILNLNEITNRMIHKMSNTTRLVDKLIDKLLVKRVVCPENRRRVNISITDKGLNLLSQIDLVIQEFENEIIHSLSEEEKNTLLNLLIKIKS